MKAWRIDDGEDCWWMTHYGETGMEERKEMAAWFIF